jgi:small-conductance mechanosensitive channel
MMIRRTVQGVAFLVILGLVLTWSLPTIAQSIPGLGWSEDDITSKSYVPTFTLGNLEIAPVFLDGNLIGTVASFIDFKSATEDRSTNFYSAAVRSQFIHSKLQKILNIMTRYTQEVLVQKGILQLEAQEQALREQLIVDVSQFKGNTSVSVTFPKDDVPEIVYSVTQADIAVPRLGGSKPLQIANRVASFTDTLLIKAWRERQTPYLLTQAEHGLKVLVVLASMSLGLAWIQKHFAGEKRKLKKMMATDSTTPDLKPWDVTSSNLKEKFSAIRRQHRQLSLTQRCSLNRFYRTGLFWLQWLLWILGLGYLCSLFYWTRPLSNWVIGITIRGNWGQDPLIDQGWPPADWVVSFGQEATLGIPLLILLLSFVARLILTGGYALSDILTRYRLKNTLPHQRHTLRAATFAQMFKGWLRVIVYLLLGTLLLYHLHQLGAVTRALAVVIGFLSFAISLASQNLLKDLIAGLLILWEDQYAVGDVISIDDQGGLVEKITLRVTQLRNLDGELITIPNGSIGIVRNLSSEWSRVNYAIEVGYDEDVDQALGVIEAVAQQLYHDPQWQGEILETPEILSDCPYRSFNSTPDKNSTFTTVGCRPRIAPSPEKGF